MKFRTTFILVLATAMICFIFFSYYHIVNTENFNTFTDNEINEILTDDALLPDKKIGALLQLTDKTFKHYKILTSNNFSDQDKVEKLTTLINITTAPNNPNTATVTPGPKINAIPGEIIVAAPGQIIAAAPGQIVVAAPGQIVAAGQIMSAGPGQGATAGLGQGATAGPGQGATAGPSQNITTIGPSQITTRPSQNITTAAPSQITTRPSQITTANYTTSPSQYITTRPSQITTRPSQIATTAKK